MRYIIKDLSDGTYLDKTEKDWTDEVENAKVYDDKYDAINRVAYVDINFVTIITIYITQ